MSALANVIPLQPHQKNRLALPSEPRLPEPAQLYALVVLAFILHRPASADGVCGQCAEPWPCPQVCLAYRLREAF